MAATTLKLKDEVYGLPSLSSDVEVKENVRATASCFACFATIWTGNAQLYMLLLKIYFPALASVKFSFINAEAAAESHKENVI